MDGMHTPPLKEFRTAPFGYSLIAFGVGNGALFLALTSTNQEADPTLSAITVGASVVGILANIVFGKRLVKRQQSLYTRLENSVAQNGYDERVFAVTTNEWCNRQTARVVCEAAGVLPEYEQLCEARKATAELTYLPHL